MVAHTFNFRTWEEETGGSQVRPWLQNKQKTSNHKSPVLGVCSWLADQKLWDWSLGIFFLGDGGGYFWTKAMLHNTAWAHCAAQDDLELMVLLP